jgi:hypothetical protein
MPGSASGGPDEGACVERVTVVASPMTTAAESARVVADMAKL